MPIETLFHKRPDCIKKKFLMQHDHSDCGIVCLANIVNYYGGQSRLEKLRKISGTDKLGTTLLGLYQASSKLGFEAEGLKADIEYLKKITSPVILHVNIDSRFRHYIVLYKYSDGQFLIGDPAKGFLWMDEEEIDKIWESRALLELKPVNGKFINKAVLKNEMKKWFIEIIREDSTILTTILVTGIIISLLGLAIAVYSQSLIDNLIPSGETIKIFLATVLVFLLLIFKAFIGYFRQLFIIRQSRDINTRLIETFFSRLLRQPVSFFNSRHTGDMIARLNDTSKIQHTITYITGELLINGLLLLVSLAAVFVYHPPAGVILLAGMPVYYLIAKHNHSDILNRQKNVMRAHAVNESNYISTIENISIIKASNKEEQFASSGQSIYKIFQEQIYKLGQTGVILNVSTEITGILLITGIIIMSVTAMLSNNMMAGEFIAVLTLANNIIPAGAALAFANIHLQSARVAFERTYEISSGESEYDSRSEEKAKKISTFKSLEIKNISFRYPGRKQLLDNISLDLKKGELKTIFGENGSGKSTLLSIIQRFYSPESGNLILNGNDISEYSIQSLRKIIGVVPQNINLFNTTILENIVLDLSPDKAEKAVYELERYELLPFFSQFSSGLATIVEERGLNISGGQKKLIGLARALCSLPQLLLVDELTSSADRHMENFFISLFMKIKHKIPILQVTHNLKAANISDEIIILEKGKITGRGNHKDLMLTDNIYSSSFMDYFVTV